MTALVIFDCDGVLIDSEIIACRVESECLTEAGFPITAEAVMTDFVGVGASALYAHVESEQGRPLPPTFRDTVQRRLAAAFERELAPMPGVVAVLDSLGAKTCVASSSRPERLRHSLEFAGLWGYFAPNVFSATMVKRGKPAPDLFLFAASRMGIEPSRCVVVEDSVPGVTAAVAAGMRVLGFNGGSHCRDGHADRLRAAGAQATFADMRQLPTLLEAL